MAGQFFEKNKRKSLAAFLLLFFNRRNAFIAAVFLVALASVTITVPPAALFRVPGVSRTLALFGMSSQETMFGSSSSLLKRALEKARGLEQSQSPLASSAPSENRAESLAFIVGGKELDEEGRKEAAPGAVARPVTPEEKDNGEGFEGVPVGDLARGEFGALAEMPGIDFSGLGLPAFPGGADYAGGPASKAAPLDYALKSSGGRVPGTQYSYSKTRTGRISSFAWKGVNTMRRESAHFSLKSSSKRAIRQLSETFTTTAMAYDAKTSLETSSVYTGSTYDGNLVDAPMLDDDGASVNTSFGNSLYAGAVALESNSNTCAEAQSTYGTQQSEDGEEMQSIAQNMGSPPACCDSGVGAWNARVARLVELCNKLNSEGSAMAAACQSENTAVDCGSYSAMHITPCSWLMCMLTIILAFILIILGAILWSVGVGTWLAAVGIGLLTGGVLMLIGQMIGGEMGMLLSLIGGVAAFFVAGLAGLSAQYALLAAMTALTINAGASLVTSDESSSSDDSSSDSSDSSSSSSG